jgi:aminomethyltransferase
VSSDPDLKRTPLYDRHVASGGRMVPFAGYAMPVQYAWPGGGGGVLAEHRWTREHAGLFDVSHMGPAFLALREPSGDGEADFARVAAIMERLVCGDIAGLKPGQLRYTLLLNEAGGIVDDLMVGRPYHPENQDALYVVVNASTKEADFALIEAAAAGEADLLPADDRALLAVQGPEAAAVVADLLPETADLTFMTLRRVELDGARIVASRSGYTGEDGFELLVHPTLIDRVWDTLIADPRVRLIGLGARDSLRLEAGLPLYGHDLDQSVSPVEASLRFAVSKRRREAGDFPGAERIVREWTDGPTRVRIGLTVAGAPAREGAEIVDAAGQPLGKVTSGGPTPSGTGNIAMGFVPPAYAEPGTQLAVVVRGRTQPAEVVPLPFQPHRYVRKV